MPLKRLEIQGFKSFADKTEFQFNPGVTIVVGPNGSGKSNIADAIRWVLGEQSVKSLRGAKMEDIIFSGSDKRKPVGMAEVSMTLDNSNGIFPIDYNEISVTRRVYRSGDSEYLINKVPCRLKDIHDLFTDTGIGKEGYSIIGQGRIDEILSTKSEDRRVIIEEAAGIVKYRNRKTEAVRKLNDTELNLTRINDIIIELETQIDPLSEQAEKARQYLNYKEEMDNIEINLLVNQIEEVKVKSEQAKESLAALNKEATSTETHYATLDSKIEELRLLVNKLDEEISTLQQNIFDISSDIERKESGIKIAEEKNNSLEEQKQRLNKEINQSQNKLDNLTEEFAGDENRYNILAERIQELTSTIQNKTANKVEIDENIIDYQCRIESGKGEIIDLLNMIANKKNQLNNISQEDVNYNKKELQLTSDIKIITTEISSVDQKNAITIEQIAKKTGRIKEIESLTSQQNRQLEDIKTHIIKVQKEITEIATQTQQNLSRQKVLTEMQQHYEGFQKGVKEILLAAHNKRVKGLCGVVAELMKVSAEYETAIEVAMGGAIQNIITETDNDAKAAIAFLKQNNFGRATFLPLNSIKPTLLRDEEKKALKMPGAIGLAADLINFDAKYQKIFAYLLGRTIVVKNVDEAVKIARECNYRVKLVTIEGDVISPGGSLTGGSYSRKGSNLLGRAREIETLDKVINQLQTKRTELATKENRLNLKINDLTNEIINLQKETQQIYIDKTGLDKDMEQLGQENKRLARELEVINMELNQLTDEKSNIKVRAKEYKEQLQELEEKDSVIKKQIENQQAELTNLQESSSLNDKEITDIKVELASVQQEHLNQQQSMVKYHQTRDELISNIKNTENEIAQIELKKLALSREIEQFNLQIKNALKEKAVLENRLQEQKGKRLNNNQELIDTENINKELHKKLTQLQTELRSAEVKAAKLEIESDNHLNKLMEEHGLNYEEALLQKTEIANRREVINRIKELKDLINNLGIINVGAIEEYNRVKERYDFLSSQYSDLEEARQSLYKVIAEMDQIMVQRFQESFTIINKNFNEVFSELFGGGKAELQLTDANNLLETGIEIIAQPPGKKFQHLSLLSGGERALTAIALLFAILKTKPSPFCALDEIEASLDEANVSRFAEFLKEFAQKTQFIVISHRKGTMEVADVLYGVTIDDTGVSKMVSMKLTAEEEKVS